MRKLSYNEMGKLIIGACIEVHRELGPGLLESVYEECLAYELQQAGLYSERQVEIPVLYKGSRLQKSFVMDVVVEDKIVLELKAVQEIVPVNHIQLLTYMRLAELKLGYLVNFNVELMRQGIHRKINGSVEI